MNLSSPGPMCSTTPVLDLVDGTDPAFDATPSIVRRTLIGMKSQIVWSSTASGPWLHRSQTTPAGSRMSVLPSDSGKGCSRLVKPPSPARHTRHPRSAASRALLSPMATPRALEALRNRFALDALPTVDHGTGARDERHLNRAGFRHGRGARERPEQVRSVTVPTRRRPPTESALPPLTRRGSSAHDAHGAHRSALHRRAIPAGAYRSFIPERLHGVWFSLTDVGLGGIEAEIGGALEDVGPRRQALVLVSSRDARRARLCRRPSPR